MSQPAEAQPTHATREDQRLAWARIATGNPDAGLARASTDAGFRSYWPVSYTHLTLPTNREV